MVTYAEDRSCITQFELGELFHKGDPKSRDFDEAFKWYKTAAEKGSRQSRTTRALMPGARSRPSSIRGAPNANSNASSRK